MEKQIFVYVRYVVKPGQREAFLQKAESLGIVRESRAEAGNIKYEYAIPVDSENDIIITEIWADSEVQAKHGETAHYKKLTELKKDYITDVIIEKYHISAKL